MIKLTIYFKKYTNIINFYKFKNIMKIFVYTNTTDYINLLINTKLSNFTLDNHSKSLTMNVKKVLTNYNLFKKINYYINLRFLTFFTKIKFNGKGFRIQFFRKKKILNFTFGHSHIYMIYLNNVNIKKLSKAKYLLFTKNIKDVFYIKKLVNEIKPIDFYTLRGLRTSRLKIIKRKGRKSPNI